MPGRLSVAHKVELILLYGKYRNSVNVYRKVVNDFNQRYAGSNVSPSSVLRLVRKFSRTGSVTDQPRTGRRRSTTNVESSTDVLALFEVDPHLSVSCAALESNVSETSVRRILRANCFHPYKMFLCQGLHAEDVDTRLNFCEGMLQIIENNATYCENIIFSDEATFNLHGGVNRHNCRY